MRDYLAPHVQAAQIQIHRAHAALAQASIDLDTIGDCPDSVSLQLRQNNLASATERAMCYAREARVYVGLLLCTRATESRP